MKNRGQEYQSRMTIEMLKDFHEAVKDKNLSKGEMEVKFRRFVKERSSWTEEQLNVWCDARGL